MINRQLPEWSLFAAAYAQGYLAGMIPPESHPGYRDVSAWEAAEFADNMLKERERRNQEDQNNENQTENNGQLKLYSVDRGVYGMSVCVTDALDKAKQIFNSSPHFDSDEHIEVSDLTDGLFIENVGDL